MASSAAAAPTALDTTTPIIVFGLSRGALHHGALGIARSGGRMRIPVYRVSRERWAPAAMSRYGRGWISVREDASDEQILDSLRKLAQRIGRAILIPVDDAGSVFVDTHAAALEAEFIFPRQPAGLARELSSKREMYELCTKHDIPTPASLFPRTEADVLELAEHTSFPTVVKCINAGDTPPSSPRVAIFRMTSYRQRSSKGRVS